MDSCLFHNKWSSDEQISLSSFTQCNGRKGPTYLWSVEQSRSDFVSTKKGKKVTLKKPAGATIIFKGLEDTIYSGKEREAEVNGWGKFYLPKTVEMKVIGVVEGTSCPCEQLVLMICEDQMVYAYDGEELHLVASDQQVLLDEGIEYPSSTSYYNGEAFKHMTKEDWEEVRKGPVGRRLDEEHRKLVASKKSRLMENLRLARLRAATGMNRASDRTSVCANMNHQTQTKSSSEVIEI